MHHYGPLWSIVALHYVHVVYITALFPHCILSATVFPISTIFSPSFFSSAIFFSISIYCGFTFFYHYAALVVPSCTWLCFFLFSFALLMWKSLFSADNSFFVIQLYIGISPIILFKNLTLFMCRNLLVRHYYLSCLCLYSLSLCKNKYVSWSTTPIYSVFEAISKRRFLHRKNLSTCNSKRRFLHSRKRKFLFHFSPASMPTTLIQAPSFSNACAKRGFYTGKTSFNTLHLCLHGNALPLSQKRDFHPAQFVAATDSIQKKLWKQRFFHGKKEVSTCLFWLIGL